MTDLSIFNTEKLASDGAELHLAHPVTGEPVYLDDEQKMPITIAIMGTDSDVYQKALQKAAVKARNAKSKNNESDFEQALTETIELYADMTLGWTNINHEGKALKFTRDNAVLLYKTYKEIRKQVGDFAAEKANFIKG